MKGRKGCLLCWCKEMSKERKNGVVTWCSSKEGMRDEEREGAVLVYEVAWRREVSGRTIQPTRLSLTKA